MLPLTIVSNKSLIIGGIFLECLTEQVPGRNRNKTYQKPPKYSLLSAYCNCNPKFKLLEGSQSDLNVWKFKEVLIPSGEFFKLDFVKSWNFSSWLPNFDNYSEGIQKYSIFQLKHLEELHSWFIQHIYWTLKLTHTETPSLKNIFEYLGNCTEYVISGTLLASQSFSSGLGINDCQSFGESCTETRQGRYQATWRHPKTSSRSHRCSFWLDKENRKLLRQVLVKIISENLYCRSSICLPSRNSFDKT